MIKDGEMGLVEMSPLKCGSCKKLRVIQLSWLSLLTASSPSFMYFFPPNPPMPEAHNACWSPEEKCISSAPKQKNKNTTTTRQRDGD